MSETLDALIEKHSASKAAIVAHNQKFQRVLASSVKRRKALEEVEQRLADAIHRERIRSLIGKTANFRPGFRMHPKISGRQFTVLSVERTNATVVFAGEEKHWTVPLDCIRSHEGDTVEFLSL